MGRSEHKPFLCPRWHQIDVSTEQKKKGRRPPVRLVNEIYCNKAAAGAALGETAESGTAGEKVHVNWKVLNENSCISSFFYHSCRSRRNLLYRCVHASRLREPIPLSCRKSNRPPITSLFHMAIGGRQSHPPRLKVLGAIQYLLVYVAALSDEELS